MNKEMIVSSNGHQTMVAILEDDLVSEVFIERERQRGRGRQRRSRGASRRSCPACSRRSSTSAWTATASSTSRDVVDTIEEFERLESGDEDEDEAKRGAATPRAAPTPKIEDLIREGQEIIVQIAKEPLGTKGARLTSHVTMAGRFLVFMPTVDHIGVSRKIESREERARLRGIVRQFREKQGFTGGVIIRTAAASRPDEDIVYDLVYFQKIWSDVRQRVESVRAPAVVYREQGLVTKLVRDLLTDDFTAIRIDDRAGVPARQGDGGPRDAVDGGAAEALREGRSRSSRSTASRREIDKALKSKVWLKSGGYIVINQTEALVAIDVNTGRYVGKKNGRLEDTIVKTNLEAVKEIVRQMRLRDLGGIIVLDFIDMEEKKNRQKVLQAVELELKKDRSPSKALPVSDFGLIIITRKRVKQSLERDAHRAVPLLLGQRRHQVRRRRSATRSSTRSARSAPEVDGPGIVLRVNPDIARALKEEEADVLKELKDTLRKDIILRADTHLHHEQFDVMAR